jgi:hypothetical protein
LVCFLVSRLGQVFGVDCGPNSGGDWRECQAPGICGFTGFVNRKAWDGGERKNFFRKKEKK